MSSDSEREALREIRCRPPIEDPGFARVFDTGARCLRRTPSDLARRGHPISPVFGPLSQVIPPATSGTGEPVADPEGLRGGGTEGRHGGVK